MPIEMIRGQNATCGDSVEGSVLTLCWSIAVQQLVNFVPV